MIINSPNHCWCCHTQQHTAFPTGRSWPPSCSQFLCYHHLPRKLKSSQKGGLLLFGCCRNTSNPEDGISQNTSFLFFLLVSASKSMVRALEAGQQYSWEAVHPSHINLKTLSKQTLEYDHLGAKVKKISSSTMAAEKGRQRPALPSPMESTASLSGCYLITYTFKSPLFHQLNEFCCWTL